MTTAGRYMRALAYQTSDYATGIDVKAGPEPNASVGLKGMDPC
jgi:hypothetical protein